MKKYSEFLTEAIIKMPDESLDAKIQADLGKGASVITFEYNAEAVMELAKHCGDVYVTKDKKYFHIADGLDKEHIKILKEVRKKYNLKELN